MKKILIILIINSFYFSLFSQEETTTLEIEKTRKYYTNISLGFNMGSVQEYGSRNLKGGMGFRYAMGYNMNRWLNFGAGTGFEFYDFGIQYSWTRIDPIVFIPLFAEVRGDFLDKKITPFYSLQLGYGFKVPTENDDWGNKPGGTYFRPALGCKFKLTEKFSSSVSFGYELQHARYKRDDSWGEDPYINDIRRTYQRYFIQFGFGF